MSGTSADGMDTALAELTGSGTSTRLKLLAFKTFPYPTGYKAFLLKNSDASTARLDDVTRLNMLIAQFSATAVKKIVRSSGKQLTDIDLIGSHGQTIHHLPAIHQMFGTAVRATLQIGNPSAIAKLTGITTVGDFRIGDIAVGGSGAPLVPLFDYLMLRSRTKNRSALNIGGIANITVLPRHCSSKQVLAFDTGPGNMIIDGLMGKFYGKPFDNKGATASSGNIIPSLLRTLCRHPYFTVKPPKSTGRELFGQHFISKIIPKASRYPKEDIIATVTEFTALTIYQQYLKFVRPICKLDELFISGGGIHNAYLMNALRRYFESVAINTTDRLKIDPDAKEAVCFALLANETISGNPGNIPGATGAKRQTPLGVICLP